MKNYLLGLKIVVLVIFIFFCSCKTKDTTSESVNQSEQSQLAPEDLTGGKMKIWEGTLPCTDCRGKYLRIMLASNGKTATLASKELGKEQAAQVAEVLASTENTRIDGKSGKLLSFSLNGKAAFIPYLLLEDGNASRIYLLNEKREFYKDASGKPDANYMLLEREQ